MKRVVLSLVLSLVACGKKQEAAPTPAPGSAAPTAQTEAPPAGEKPMGKMAPAGDEKVTAFWKWFSDNAEKLHAEKNLEGVMNTISAELAKVQDGVFAEIGADGDERMLVISVDGKRDLFPFVTQIYDARPQAVKGWKVVAFRPRAKGGDGFAIEMAGKKIAPADVKFVSEVAGNKLDIVVYIPGFDDSDAVKQVAFILLDHVVGELDMETKIAGIDFAPLDKAPATAKTLPDLAAAVDAVH